MTKPDDELQKIFRQNREELLQRHKAYPISSKISLKPCKGLMPSPSGGWDIIDTHELAIEFDDPVKTISSQRDLQLEKDVWQQKIQPISDNSFNGEFQYDPYPDVIELTNESIIFVHEKIFRMFNQLIDFQTQLKQMAPSPSMDPGRACKELVLAFDDIVLKKLRAGLGNTKKNELFFDFLQDIYDTNSLPAFLTYLGYFCTTLTKPHEKETKRSLEPKLECQRIGKGVWEEYPDLLIKHLKQHPKIRAIRKTNGEPYALKTLHNFLAEIAPKQVSSKQRPSKKLQARQAEICEKLGINPKN